jgi:uncharacterized protein (TIGR03437 family)
MRRICRAGLRYFLLIALGAGISAGTGYGQEIFYARDFLFTLQFNPGRDVWPERAGSMALHPRGIYVAGAFQIGGIDFRGYLRRYDLSGNEMWTRQIDADTFPTAIAVDATAVYVAGHTGVGHGELFVRKYDENGNEVWSRQIRIAQNAYHVASGLATDLSGVYLAAWSGYTQGLVRKYSPTGDELWTRSAAVRSPGGLAVDGTSVYTSGTNDSGGFVSKYASGGDALWTRQLAASETDAILPGAVAADSSGIYVGGAAYRKVDASGPVFLPASGEAFLRKLDGSGNEVWARRFSTDSFLGMTSLALDSAGIYVTGGTIASGPQVALPGQCKAGAGDVFVRKYDTVGGEQWTRQFGTAGFDFAGTVAVDSSGVYVSGATRGAIAHGSVFVAKLGKTQTVPSDSRPQISWECVVNAASYAGGGVAPGEIVTIFGRAMGPPELTPLRAEGGRLATMLAEARVLFNGIPAPLIYVSATQSSAIVPYEIAGKSPVAVEIEYRGVRSDPITVPNLGVRPGIFTANGSGIGQGAILNEDGSRNSPENPAARGSIIVMYVTGEGLVAPAVADGAILGGVLPKPQQPPSVAFEDLNGDGSPAEVLYAGGVSGSVAGLLQINLRVPTWVRPGNAVPIYLQNAELGVTVAVR